MSKTKLFGLVLAGGKSKRMGTDKGKIQYHGAPQREHAYKMLNNLCERTFYSIRKDQVNEFENQNQLIIDHDEYRGPYNGILSAHREYPNVAWLVLATDLPLLTKKDLEKLIDNRDTTKLASAFSTSLSNLPEPLIAIWEIEGLKKSIEYLNSDQGTCPRKFLINHEVCLVYPDDDLTLTNANTEEELYIAKKKLQTK